MKRIQLLILTGLVLFIIKAGAQQQALFTEETKNEARQQVSLQEVKSAAVSALVSRTERVDIDGEPINEQAIDTVFTLNSEKNNTLLYECKFSGGKTVLMSGSKACVPVLGYFDSSPDVSVLDPDADIPDGLRFMLDEYRQQIELAFAADDTIQLYKETEWKELQNNKVMSRASPGAYDIVSPLITSKWNQSKSNDKWTPDEGIYNFYAPSSPNCRFSGYKCRAGCAAVAMAQIMYYWKHPVSPTSITGAFDWCNMVDSLLAPTYPNPDYVNIKAVARLIYDCGLSMGIHYCLGGECASGPSDDPWGTSIRNAFANTFQYNASSVISRGDNTSEWINKIKGNLNAGRPVYYLADNTVVGHAFILDGYDSANYFHINWGWGGFEDSWFILDGLVADNYNFFNQHRAIFDIYPSGSASHSNVTSLADYYTVYESAVPSNSRLAPYENIPERCSDLKSATSSDPATWRTIPSGKTATYTASSSVTLLPGFCAEEGSAFTAQIEPFTVCQPSSRAVLMDDGVFGEDISYLEEGYYNEEVLDTEETIAPDTQAHLYQNIPNPFTGETVIGYYIPESAGSAYLRFMTAAGVVAKAISLSTFGEGEVSISASELSAGIYFYTLVVDGQIVNSRQMVVGN